LCLLIAAFDTVDIFILTKWMNTKTGPAETLTHYWISQTNHKISN